jgi:hypothetical protein
MILDEIDEMVEHIKTAYTDMETMYAKYLPYFPIQGGIIDDLNRKLNKGKEGSEPAARHDKTTGTGKELMNVRDALLIVDHIKHRRENPEHGGDGFQPMNSETFKHTIRMLFRKINQMCHPDKTKRFNRITVQKLRECFDDAQKAYEHRDMDTLELTFIRVAYLRDELHKLSQEDVNRITDQYENLKLDMKGLQMHRLYMVLVCHRQAFYRDATAHFGVFLQEHIAKLQDIAGRVDRGADLNEAAAAYSEDQEIAPELTDEDREIADDYDRWVEGDDDPELTEYRSVSSEKDDE